MLKLLRVEGHSMAPDALEGDFVLIHSYFKMRESKQGDWLVFDHPSFGLLLKECVAVDIMKLTFRSKSLGPHGLTEKEIGDISFSRIMGKVCCHIPYHTA